MQQIPIENRGKTTIYVGGRMIPPGETRHFPEDEIPPEFRQPAETRAEPAAADPVQEFLAASAAQITGGLDVLSDQFLEAAENAEMGGKARKGVLQALAAERLARAERAAFADVVIDNEGGEG